METKAPGRGRPLQPGEHGFTLVELIIAAGLASLLIGAISHALGAAQTGNRYARSLVKANAAARGTIETMRGLGWANLAHPAGSLAGDPLIVGGRYDPDGRGPLAPEAVVYDAEGAVTPPVTTRRYDGVDYLVHAYVTDAGGAIRRLSVLVAWVETGVPHVSSLSTLVHPVTEDIGAAAAVLLGRVGGVAVREAYVEAESSGGSGSTGFASFQPAQGLAGATGSAAAGVVAGPVAHSEASMSSLSVNLVGLSVQAAGVRVQADSSRAGMSVSAVGSVTVNGVLRVNPSPGTEIRIPGWRIVLNDQRREIDGSLSVTYIRIEGDLGDEVSAAWAWVWPAEFLSA
ncbi:MAG: type II secretion system protein [Actinomycetota bacterium]